MSAAAARSSVLVIEDHPFQRRALARKLHGLGVPHVLEATGGADALEIVRTSGASIALILSDADIPEMEGREFLRRLAADAPQTAVAVLSTLDRTLPKSIEAIAAEYGLHLVGVLEKPVSDDALRAVLVRSLECEVRVRAAEPDAQITHPAQLARIAAAFVAGELVPWFQPQVNLHTAQVCGAEVLVRWERPGLPPLAPACFLEAVRAADLMRAMTLSLAASAVRHLKTLPGRGPTLSLNICPTLLEHPDFADALARTLIEAGATPRDLILEITESAASLNHGAALEHLSRLRTRGFELSLDDFGTGSSSLAQLVRTPVSELKIDRTFISRVTTDDPDRLLVDSAVLLAQRLKLRTVAEGIETQAELDALRALGCELGQGYLFARPMPAAEWLSWMQGPERPIRERAPAAQSSSSLSASAGF